MNLNEILKSDIGSVWKDNDNFYATVNTGDMYNNSIYVINIETKKVSWKLFTVFMFDNLENSVESSKEEFRETFSKSS